MNPLPSPADVPFQLIFECLPGNYLILAADEPVFTIVAVSDAYASATLTVREQIVGRGIFEVFPDNPDDPNADGVANLSASLHQALVTKTAHRMAIQKYDVPRPDGTGFEKKYWSPLNTPVVDRQGQVNYLIHQVEDVTAKLELNTALDYQTERLQKANEELEQIVRVTSHDLQEPARKIRTFCGLVNAKYADRLDEDGRQQLGKILESAERLTGRLKDLLRYAHLTKKELFVKVNLQEIVENVISELELLIEDKRAVIKVGNLPSIIGSPHQLHQLFYNLLLNSLRFTADKRNPEITVECKLVHSDDASQSQKDYVSITICDNGIGFDPKQSDKIFTVFERLHTSKYEGTGIGLSICKKVASNHGGEIIASGEPDKGACFQITLPLSVPDPPEMVQPAGE